MLMYLWKLWCLLLQDKEEKTSVGVSYIFCPMVEFSWKSRSMSMSTLQVVIHHVIPPTTYTANTHTLLWNTTNKINFKKIKLQYEHLNMYQIRVSMML